ncbi:hypothetical protein BT96DRAFT_647771 [Gymnopus androsaceus JB14]|uniref:50S ribosomal protein L35 n=1 Tax=Gymnopus androsaceus JB14 TaxID=1447944 RepID=A0A6A4HQX8_9AGAR|nr:hypothetical protein BT96DRAFT_647771 [Gymnopus androsaceus JB14]
MFFSLASNLRSTISSSHTWGPRMFSVTSVAEAGYKMKSHSGAKKRWRSLASGSSFKRGKANHQHLNVAKAPARKRSIGTDCLFYSSSDTQAKKAPASVRV